MGTSALIQINALQRDTKAALLALAAEYETLRSYLKRMSFPY
jgi:hypothetical protein